jgi:hypothetical protein
MRAESLKSHATKACILSSLLLLLLLAQGCSDVDTLVWNKADTVIDGHRIVISPCRDSYTKTINDTPTDRYHIFGCKAVEVKIKNEELTVNDKPYGTLSRGDSVTVKNGQVYINGKEAVVVARNLSGANRTIESSSR